MIKTPDQRARVFVSSTLQELAEERKVVKKAIESIHLIPVMFELGARPHPPRLLYQSYLKQSNIFIGIYWNSYGWIGEDMSISGIEDEYNLSESKPRLIYIKASTKRDLRLDDLIKKIQQRGDVSYKSFENVIELKSIVTHDLVSILSERSFDTNEESVQKEKPIFFNSIPVPFNQLIGREKELSAIEKLIFKEKKRLVNVIGMGGTGKTRLAIEFSSSVLEKFSNGVCFISLTEIKDFKDIERLIAKNLSITDSSMQSLRETLLSYLSDKNILIVLDNFEHVLPSANIVSEILSRCKDVVVLVTSRSPLNLIAEQLFPLSTLALFEHAPVELEDAVKAPSLKLFIERTTSVNPKLQWSKEMLKAAYTICELLGGLPLAIELVAKRFRYSTPVEVINGMQKTLDLMNDGSRDLPDRQKSFRATLTWSYELLSELDKITFRITSLFQNGWFIPALSSVRNLSIEDCQASIERLMDVGLVRFKGIEHSGNRYDNLQPIVEFASELMESDVESNKYKKAFIDFYFSLSYFNHYSFYNEENKEWHEYVKTDYENIRMAFLLSIKDGNRIASLALLNSCCNYWMFAGLQNEGLKWIEEIHFIDETKWQNLTILELKEFAITTLYSGIFKFIKAEYTSAMIDLEKAMEKLMLVKDNNGIARVYVYMALTELSFGGKKCQFYFEEAIRIGKECNDSPSVFLSTVFLIEISIQTGNINDASVKIRNAEQLLINKNLNSEFYGVDDLEALYYLTKGNYFLTAGNLIEAENSYNISNQSYEKKRLKTSWGFAFEGLAAVHLLKNEIELAKNAALSGVNKGREHGDIIAILSNLRIALLCKFSTDKDQKLFDLLNEIDTHFNELNYKFWSIDKSAQKWFNEMLVKNNLKYIYKENSKRMSTDDLIHAVLILF